MTTAERETLPEEERYLWPAVEEGRWINSLQVGCHICRWKQTAQTQEEVWDLFADHEHDTIYDVEYRLYTLAPKGWNLSEHYARDMLWLWDRRGFGRWGRRRFKRRIGRDK